MGQKIKIFDMGFYAIKKQSNAFLFFIASISLTGSLQAQHFIPYQDSAHIDHIFDQTAFLGGGAVFFDYDNDQDEDLYITAGNDRDHFYENNGDGTFTYKSVEAGFIVTKLYYTTGVIAGDIDNDGFKDLFITTWFSDLEPIGKNLLYKNNGDGTFTEIWNHNTDADKTQCMGATFIDFNLDGLLDLYTISYVEESAFLYDDNGTIIGYDHTCHQNRFYKNIGNGQFEEMTFQVNLDNNGCSLATSATDFDLDGDMDILLANDFGEFIQPNQLFENNFLANGIFLESGPAFNADAGMYGMGIAVGDIDNDLDLDYYVTNFGKNLLLENNESGFNNITDASGSGDEWIIGDSLNAVGWGTVFLDIDNDMDLDLYVGNGYVPSPAFLSTAIFQNDQLFLNDGNAHFTNIGPSYGIENPYTTRGVTYADYDNDGDLDILAVVENVPVNDNTWATVLYNNQAGNDKNWLQISLEGIHVNRDAYGSKVYLFAGDKILLQEVSGGDSHASQISSRIHFGLDDVAEVDSLQIWWTGGENVQTHYNITANQHIYIQEDTTTQIINAVEEEWEAISFSLSPNPAKDQLSVHFNKPATFSEGSLSFYNTTGQKVKQYSFRHSSNRIALAIHELPAGIYMVELKISGQVHLRKLVVQ